MPSRKLSANSFLSARNTVVPCRTGNLSQTVFCWQETQCCHVSPVISSGVEKSPGEKFPVGKKHNGVTLNRKPFANSFLSARNTVVLSRIGNPPQTVSCRQETQCCHVSYVISSGAKRSREISQRKVSCRYETQWRQAE